MTTNPVLPDLRDELAALRARVTQLEAAPTSGPARPARRNTPRRWRPRRRLATALLLTLLLLSVPVGVLAATFADVPSSNPYHDDIHAIADAGIMAACNPPANDKFCPRDRPQRDQLAGSLARLAG